MGHFLSCLVMLCMKLSHHDTVCSCQWESTLCHSVWWHNVVTVEPRRWGGCSLLTHSRVHSPCLAVSQTPRSKQEMNPAHTVRSSLQRAAQRPANTAPRPHAAFSSVCHYWCHFLVANAIATNNHWCSAVTVVDSSEQSGRADQSEHSGLTGRGGRSSNKPFRTESEYTYFTEMLFEKPMWVWNIEQCKSILVDLNNGIMISRNGHDMGPLRW